MDQGKVMLLGVTGVIGKVGVSGDVMNVIVFDLFLVCS